MKVDAQERLDNPLLLEDLDPAGMLRQVASSAAQVRTAMRVTQETDLDAIIEAGRPRAMVVTGMGGSGVAGDALAAICAPGCPVPVVAWHDYQLPAWVGAADLVIAVSCSGATEETLAAATAAVRRGCRLIGVGGAGSPLAMIAEQSHAPFISVQSAGQPRATFWGLFVPLVVVASHLGLLEVTADAYESAAAELEHTSYLCRPGSDAFVNPAKSLALDLSGTLPMVWGTSPLTGVAAYRFACQLGENSKYPAVAGVLPEANHNQVVTFDGHFAAGPDGSGGGPALPLRLVLLRDTGEHPQVTRRREESAKLAAQRGIDVTELAVSGSGPLERLASLVQLIDYATVYLGIAQGIDPGPVAAIHELKARIA